MTWEFAGQLWDMSEAGARLQLADPPPVGATALLRWTGREAVCTVVWADGEMCGIAFTRPVSPEVVAEAAGLNRVVDLPIAQVGNIAQGRKRSAFRAGLSANDETGV